MFSVLKMVIKSYSRFVSAQRVRHSYQGTMISLKLTFSHLKNLNQLVTEERLGEILARLILIIDSDYRIDLLRH